MMMPVGEGQDLLVFAGNGFPSSGTGYMFVCLFFRFAHFSAFCHRNDLVCGFELIELFSFGCIFFFFSCSRSCYSLFKSVRRRFTRF